MSDNGLMQRRDDAAQIDLVLFYRFRDLRLNHVHLRAGLIDAYTGTQPGDGSVIEVAHHLQFVFGKAGGLEHVDMWREADELPELVVLWEMEIRRKNADDDKGLVIENDLSPEERRIGVEAGAPELVGNHRHAIAPGLVLIGGEGTAKTRANAQHMEEIRGDARDVQPLGRTGASEGQVHGRDDRRRFERVHTAAPDVEVHHVHWKRGVHMAHLRNVFLKRDQPAWIAPRQRLQQGAGHHREDGRVRPDAQRERADGDGRKRWITAGGAQRIANIGAELFHIPKYESGVQRFRKHQQTSRQRTHSSYLPAKRRAPIRTAARSWDRRAPRATRGCNRRPWRSVPEAASQRPMSAGRALSLRTEDRREVVSGPASPQCQ